MNLLPGNQLLVAGERQRTSFAEKAIEELAESIATSGLFHPIVLRADHRTLVAGERRVRAIALLAKQGRPFYCDGVHVPPGYIPYISIVDMEPLAIEEAELEENIRRVDLSWQDYNSVVARLHILRTKQAMLRGEKHLLSDTEMEIKNYAPPADAIYKEPRVVLKNALVLFSNFQDPEVKGAKSEKEAMKIIERKANIAHREVLSREFKALPSDHVIHCGRAEDILPTLDKGSIDVILTDPPYGIGANEFGSQADAKHEYKDSAEYALECYARIFQAAHILCKNSSFVFTFCDIRMFPAIYRLAETYLPAWGLWPTPLIWDKSGAGMLPVPDKGPRRTYEGIFYAYRGNRKWNAVGSPDIITCPPVNRPEFGAMKPVDLYLWLLGRVALPNDTVLDPYAGTGPILEAARILQCRVITIEQDQRKVDYQWTVHARDPLSPPPSTNFGDGSSLDLMGNS